MLEVRTEPWHQTTAHEYTGATHHLAMQTSGIVEIVQPTAFFGGVEGCKLP